MKYILVIMKKVIAVGLEKEEAQMRAGNSNKHEVYMKSLGMEELQCDSAFFVEDKGEYKQWDKLKVKEVNKLKKVA